MSDITMAENNPTSAWPYSGFWRRVAATVVDNLILIVPVAIVGAFTFGIGGILIYLIYGAYFESSPRRATLGKMACGIQVETEDGAQLSFGKALARQVLKLIGNLLSIITWLIFFVPAAFTKRRQGLHDLVVSTVVRHEEGKGMPGWLVGVIAAVVPAVFVLGILAAIAIPAYQDYVSRAKVAEARNAASVMKLAVSEHFTQRGALPATEAELMAATNAAPAGVDIRYRNGRIEILVRSLNKPGTLVLTPVVNGTTLDWKCSSDDLPPRMLMSDCR